LTTYPFQFSHTQRGRHTSNLHIRVLVAKTKESAENIKLYSAVRTFEVSSRSDYCWGGLCGEGVSVQKEGIQQD